MVSPHYTQQLPLIFTACHWQLQTATSDFSVPMHVLGATPIKAPFDHHLILKRSAFWRWNYFWGAPILEYMLTIKKKNIAPAITDVMRVNTAMKTSNLQKKHKNLKPAHFFKWNHLSAQCYILQWWTVLKRSTPNTIPQLCLKHGNTI